MSYPLHPVENNLKVYSANGKYIIDKQIIYSAPSFETKYVSVEGMKNVEWKIQMVRDSHWIKNWGLFLHVRSPAPLKCEVSFEIASEKNSVLKQFNGFIAAGSETSFSSVGTENFINQEFLFAKKQKFFDGQKTTLYVKASFSYTDKADQGTKMIQSNDWIYRFQTHDGKDFKIIVGNESIEIHKCFLTLQSTVFNAMLGNAHFKESQTGEMELSGFKYETIKAFVEFCYGEDISNFMELTENAIELLMFADMYDMQNLKESFAEYYSTKLTMENVADIYKVSRETNAPMLRGVCFDYIYSIPKIDRTAFVEKNLDKELHDLF
uniref:BTB domain-containing protein n=1 Tax=Panagrolaimus sp. ES5 TaxID=591445 RepID=A0AC34FHZ6_9BILA